MLCRSLIGVVKFCNLFLYPYTRIEYVQKDLDISRQTASKYLEQLVNVGLLEKHQAGRNQYFINKQLVSLLIGASGSLV